MSVKGMLKNAFVAARAYAGKKAFFSRQANTFDLCRAEIKKANSLGFTAEEYIIYDLKHNEPAEYLSEYEREFFRNAVRDYRVLLDDKIVFYSIIRNFTQANRIFAYKMHGRFVALEEGFGEDAIPARIREFGKMAYKETGSGGGVGFRLLEFSDGAFSINRKPATEEDILFLLRKDGFFLEEFCCQGAFEQQLWPYSVNTIRIVSLDLHDDVRIAAAFQRIGIDRENCVDNVCAGSLYAAIDLNTGVLSAARSRAPGNFIESDRTPRWFPKHPGTGAQIEGIRIPNWTWLCDEIRDLHRKLAFTEIEFIAWDVALLDDGFKIIEANTSCGMRILQTFGGARKGVIGKWMKEKVYIS